MRRLGWAGGVSTAVLVSLATFAVGCGKDSREVSTPAEQPAEAVATVPTTPEVAEEQFKPKVTYLVEAEAEDGATERIELEIGGLAPADEPVLDAFPDPASACTVDPVRDALIPARVTVTNTTAGFPVDTTVAVAVEWPELELTIEGAVEYSDGPSCQSTGTYDNAILRVTWTATDPGESDTNQFYFVVHDYYSPGNPEGNQDALDAAVIGFTHARSDSSGAWERTCITGPGLNGGSFTFDGSDARVARARLEDMPVSDILDSDAEPECADEEA